MVSRGRPLLLPAVVAIAGLCIATAPANIPLPALFGFRLPAWLAFLTFGVSFAVVTLVEAFVISRVARLTMERGLMISVVANALTTAVGVFAFYGPIAMLALLLIANSMWNDLKQWQAPARWRRVLPLLPAVIFLGWSLLTWSNDYGITGWAIFGSLVPAFVVTTLLEGWIARRREAGASIVRAVILANIASYALLVAMLLVAQVSRLQVPQMYPDYYNVIAIPAIISQGDIDRAMELIDETNRIARRQIPGRGPFLTLQDPAEPTWIQSNDRFPFVERRAARALAEHGYYSEAIAVYEESLTFGYLASDRAERMREEIASWEAQLTQSQPALP